MENILYIGLIALMLVVCIGVSIYVVYFTKKVKDNLLIIHEAIKNNIKEKEEMLSRQNFIISQKIDLYHCDSSKWIYNAPCIAPYILYIDNENKKWIITSPLLQEFGKIYNFHDLIGYEFFDYEKRENAAEESDSYGIKLKLKNSPSLNLEFSSLHNSDYLSYKELPQFDLGIKTPIIRSDICYQMDITFINEMKKQFDHILGCV